MKRILISMLLLLCIHARAEQPLIDTTLSHRVAQLEQQSSRWDKLLGALPKISGYVQAGYQWSDNTSTFFLKRVRLNLSGAIAPKIGYRIQMELCAPRLVDAYVEYKPLRALNLKVGQYKVPFSIENTDYSPLGLELIDYPLALTKLMGLDDLCGLSATGRDLGAMIYGGVIDRGSSTLINYDLAVFNGEGINSKDHNRSKDVASRLTLKPADGLQLSGSYYWGEYGDHYLKRVRYGAGACYDRGDWVVRSEWIGGQTGTATSAGWYAVGGWRITQKWMPIVRYDHFVADLDDRNATTQTNYTAGVLWRPVKFLRCQLNYTYEYYTSPSIDPRNVVALMFTGIF